jgi:hypothetical protein
MRRTRRNHRWMAGAGLVSLVLVANGCSGCGSKATSIWSKAAHVPFCISYSLRTWNRIACESDRYCEAVAPCPPEAVPECRWVSVGCPGERPLCRCNPAREVPDLDGGKPPFLVRCIANPDGGAPICNEVNDYFVMRDGGVRAREHGVTRYYIVGTDGGWIPEDGGAP